MAKQSRLRLNISGRPPRGLVAHEDFGRGMSSLLERQAKEKDMVQQAIKSPTKLSPLKTLANLADRSAQSVLSGGKADRNDRDSGLDFVGSPSGRYATLQKGRKSIDPRPDVHHQRQLMEQQKKLFK